MNTNKPNRRGAFRFAATWAGTAALTLGGLFGASGAFAAPAPANTLIGNQAVAGYVDSTGNNQSASSNLVQTQVQQVGSYTLINDNTKSAAGGSTVYASHTLTNTGNGSDSFNVIVTDNKPTFAFSKVEVYLDANGDGLPDSTTPLCSSVAPALCTITPVTVAGNGGTFKFVVAYTVPPGTANTTSDNASVVATPINMPANPLGYAAGNQTITNTDTVTVTTLAAFSATKSLSVPAVASAQSGGTWPAANVSGPRSSSALCAVTGAGPFTTTSTCTYTTYTINYKNTGGAAGAFYLQDTLPAGFTYVTGTAVWSSAGGTAMGEGAGGDPAGIDFVQTAQQLSARVASVGANVSGSISFVVLVNNAATVGTGSTTNTATYDQLDSAHATAIAATAGTTSTNPASFLVIASAGVVLGNATATLLTGADATAGSANGSADQNTAPSVASGGSVKFTQQLFNTGNASDTFNLSIFSNTFPGGTTFAFYAADGVTPLLDTNGDGIVDSGLMTMTSTRTIVVVATIPGSVVPPAGPFSLVARATSVGDSTKFDATNDTVTAVVGIPVDLTNTNLGPGGAGTGSGSVGNGDAGAGPSPLPTTTNTTPAGTGTLFSLYVKNNDSIDNNYNLSASQTSAFPGSLPAGWTVKFVATGGTCASAAITNTGNVAKNTQVLVMACVTPPASAPAATTNIYFNVTSAILSSAGVTVSDSKTDAVTVVASATYTATLSPNNSGQVAAGGTVVYAHTLTTTGAQACGTYTLNAMESGSTSGWTFALFIDVNGNGVIDAGDTPVVAGSTVNPALLAGASQKILVRVFAPGGATPGLNDTVTVTATFAPANGGTCNAPSATDVSTVVTGQIRVVKTQALDANCDGIADVAGSFAATLITAKPGQCIIYKVVATNEGTAPITNLSINDAVPPFTTLVVTQPAAKCVTSAGITGATAPAYVGPAGASVVSCGSAANTVAPGATLELDFAVLITP